MRPSIKTAILAEANAAKGIIDVAEKEERDLTDVERDTIDAHMKKATELQQNAEKEKAFRSQMLDLSKGLGIGETPDELKARRDELPRKGRKSAGHAFVDSQEYKSLLSGVPNGNFSEKMRVQSSPVDFARGMKDLFFSGDREDSAGFLVEDDRRGLLDPFYERPLSVRQLFSSGSTTSDTIDYVRLVAVDNNAAVVPEARTTDPVGVNGATTVTAGVKPQSGFEFDRDSTTVKTIAHWIPITKRALSDAAQIRTMIDSFLRYGLEEALEDELLTGVGTGEHFLGLYNTPGIQTQAAPAGAQDNLDVTRLARTKVQIGGRARPTAYVMNPLDWQNVELLRNDTGDFYGGGPFQLTTPRLWGLPVIESEAVTPGTAWCAAWNWGVIYDREQASVQATDSHADFFVRNLVAILAEMRAAFAILRPSAFVKITLAV
jgi:HK97 family phage major capsid protein